MRSLKVLGFDQNAIGMNTVKNSTKLFLNLEKKLFIKSKFVSLYLTKKIHDDVEL